MRWVLTSNRNIQFLDLDDDLNDYTIFDAELFLGTKSDEKYSQDLVLFLRESTINEIFWRTPS